MSPERRQITGHVITGAFSLAAAVVSAWGIRAQSVSADAMSADIARLTTTVADVRERVVRLENLRMREPRYAAQVRQP